MREGHSLPVWPILVSSFGKPFMAKRQTFHGKAAHLWFLAKVREARYFGIIAGGR